MLHLLGEKNIPLFLEGFIHFIAIVGLSLIIAIVLAIISQLLLEGYKWITDTTKHIDNPLLSFMDKHKILGCDPFGSIWMGLIIIGASIVFYELSALGTIIFAIMYVMRSTVRIKTLLTKHISDKKAHK